MASPKSDTSSIEEVSDAPMSFVDGLVTPSGLLLTTTDTRMQKPNHLKHDPAVEFAWWIEESAIQFRATGPAVTIPHEASSVEAELKKLSVSPEAEDGKGDWWVEKRKEIWGKEMSGHLRGSFGRPPPGKPLSEIEEKPENWITRLDEKSVSPTKFHMCSQSDVRSRTIPSSRRISTTPCRTSRSSPSRSTSLRF
jgi:hypothetical protein